MPSKKTEVIQEIPLSELHPFKGHPFKVVDDEAMQRTVESVAQYGVLAPAIARPRAEGGYELIAGHRRMHAAALAGRKTIPVIVRQIDDDTATIMMVDSNLQRESLLPSERAFAYKMKLEAMKRRAGRPSKGNMSPVGTRKRSDELLAEQVDSSRNQVQRFVRLTHLIPELLELVDQKQIAFNPAVELSFLTPKEQRGILEAMEYTQNTPSLSQAQRLKRLSQMGLCTQEAMNDILGEVKKREEDRVTIENDVLWKYFPRSYTPKQMRDVIIRLLEQWKKRRRRTKE